MIPGASEVNISGAVQDASSGMGVVGFLIGYLHVYCTTADLEISDAGSALSSFFSCSIRPPSFSLT